jgi:hypothetical protein
MKLSSAFVFILPFLFALSAAAQTELPKPPELKKLDVFAGSWSLTGEMKAGPMGPGGSMTETETCKWMDGGYFLQCQSDFRSSMGNGTGISFMGYDANDKTYTYDEFNSMGEAEHAKGTLDGDTWAWSSEENMSGQPMKAHFTIKMPSPNSYSFKFDMSQDGTTWATIMDGKATKEK